MNRDKIQYFRNLLSPIILVALLVISIIIHVLMPISDRSWIISKLIIGLFGLIFLPGFALATITLDDENVNVYFPLILGFMLQLLNVYAIWAIHIFYGRVNFTLLIYVLTLIETICVVAISHNRKLTLNINNKMIKLFKLDSALVVVIALYLFLALYWQQWAPAPHTDGAAYLDLARNAVSEGKFYSKQVFPYNTFTYACFSSGRIDHMFGYFAIALFFMLGDISLFSAKIMLIFTGMLIIILLYDLTKRLFNMNVARLAVLIAAISPELLTHVGLVGGPEIPSALFTLFTIYILINSLLSSRSMSIAFIAGLSLFVAWYAWYFNFLVTIAFLPLLFMFISNARKDFTVKDMLLFMILLITFILEYRILLYFTYMTLGMPIPTLFVVALVLLYYYFRLKNGQHKNTLITFSVMFLALYLMFYVLSVVGSFIPVARSFEFATSSQTRLESHITANISIFLRTLNLQEVNKYWNMYWDGVYVYLGQIVVFLGFMSLTRIDKLKETSLLLSFPILQAILWSLFNTIDAFQPRFIVCSSFFYYILAASVIEMLYTYASGILKDAKLIHLQFKIMKKKFSSYVHLRKLAETFVLLLLLLSLFTFAHPIYDEDRKVMENWNYPEKLDMLDTFEWIRNNTSPETVIAARYSYYPWYTNRLTVNLAPSLYPNLNLTGLVKVIRNYKVSYLVVDQSLVWEQGGLSLLYYSPAPFFGSKIVWDNRGPHGFRTVIYDVRNIAFGERKEESFIINLGNNSQWVIAYGIGKINMNNGTICVNITSDENGWHIVDFYTGALNLTGYDIISFQFKHNVADLYFSLELKDIKGNIVRWEKTDGISKEWATYNITLSSFKLVAGSSFDWSSIVKIRFRPLGLPNTSYVFCIRDLRAFRIIYTLDH